MQRIYLLKGKVQHYAWGGFNFIPELLGTGNIEKKPFAEYWLGAHPAQSSILEQDGQEIMLNQLIEKAAPHILGENTVRNFQSLPYLFKILDVRQMLSIQVHPSKGSAEEGFRKENEKGIPLTAAHRNYKDDNHKPEMMIALSDFWLLHGFKPATELEELFSKTSELSFLKNYFNAADYKTLYDVVMTMPQQKVNDLLQPLANRITPLYQKGLLQKQDEDFWAARAVQTFCKNDSYDRGIFSIYLFNLVYLKKGEGIYQAAGLPHAYLEGQNVEVMANSDNVLRAGLTDKYIDVPELLQHVRFEATHPCILQATGKGISSFSTPAKEFAVTEYNLSKGAMEQFTTASPEIVFVVEGSLAIMNEDTEIIIQRGEAVFSFAQTSCSITAMSNAIFFRVSVPEVKN